MLVPYIFELGRRSILCTLLVATQPLSVSGLKAPVVCLGMGFHSGMAEQALESCTKIGHSKALTMQKGNAPCHNEM